MNVIELPRPHGFLIWKGKQTAIATDEPLPIDNEILIVSEGEAFGKCKLAEPAQIKTEAFHGGQWQDEHCIYERERRQYWPDAKMLYVHRLIDWQPFEAAKAYENGQVIDRELTERDQKVIGKAMQLPKTITLDDSAVVMSGGKFIVKNDIAHTEQLKEILKATYNKEPEFIDVASADELALYQLALVRVPRMTVKKNEPVQAVSGGKVEGQQEQLSAPAAAADKQEDNDMPWEKVQNHPGCSESEPWGVVKVDDGELEGCHASEPAANRQLAALNIAEQERALHDDDEDEDKNMADKQQSIDQRLDFIRQQFIEIFDPTFEDNIWVRDIFDTFVIANDDGRLFRVSYMMAEDSTAITFASRDQWVEVEVTYIAKEATLLWSDSVRDNKQGWKNKLIDIAKNVFGSNSKDASILPNDLHLNTPFGMAVKATDGELWHLTMSTNAFEDREGEIFSTKALKDYVDSNLKNGKKGTFDFWHLPGTDFAEKKWQGVSDRFLFEAGPYLKTEIGQRAKQFFTEFPDGHPNIAPEGWGASPEFRFLPEDREDKVFDTIWIVKTSTLPRFAAANIWTEGKQIMTEQKRFEDQPRAAGVAMLGEEIIQQLEALSNKTGDDLDEAGVDSKENKSTNEAESQKQEASENVGIGTDTPTIEDKGQEAEKESFDINELGVVVSKLFIPTLEPLAEAVVTLATEVKTITERLAILEKDQAIKSQVETSRFLNQLVRASKAEETVVADDDDLKEKGPKQRKPIDEGASVASAFFSNQ